MVGFMTWAEPQKGQRRIRLEERLVLRMRFLQAEITASPHGAVLRRRVLAAGKKLRKRGVSQVVLPEAFPYGEELAKCGLRPVSTLALRRGIAADWVRAELAAKDRPVAGARVAVTAASLTGEVVRTVTELCLRHRYVLMDLPYGGEELCRQLRREYGVSLLLGPSKDQLEGAEALVLFDSRTDLSLGNPVALRLYDEKQALPSLALPPTLEEALPEGADRGQLLAVLREAGILKREQIVVGS
ncbi:hypothetical protein AALC17_03595 [Oscillospiraceae bacterium 38-13]